VKAKRRGEEILGKEGALCEKGLMSLRLGAS
jgi:hypothetical protein